MSDHDLVEALQDESKLTEKQILIIQAAIEMFAEKGYAATSTSEIAKRAGVAEGTIFRHYKTKKELLMTIVTPMFTKYIVPIFANQMMKEVFNKKYVSFDELLRSILINRFEFVKKNVPLFRIILQEVAFHPELKDMMTEVFSQKVFPRFKELLSSFKEKGEIAEDIPNHVIIRLIMTTIIGFLITRFIVLPEQDWDDESEMERTIQFIINGLKNK